MWVWQHQITPLAEQGDHVVVDVLALADGFDGRRFHLVGHDWGGIVAWAVDASHPERLGHLVAMDAPHPEPPAGRQ